MERQVERGREGETEREKEMQREREKEREGERERGRKREREKQKEWETEIVGKTETKGERNGVMSGDEKEKIAVCEAAAIGMKLSVGNFTFLASAYECMWPVISLAISSSNQQLTVSIVIIAEKTQSQKMT